MSARKTLLEIEYHSDDETGMYQIGEIDFGISGLLDDYLKNYGYAGKKDIIDTLGYLIYEVERRFRESKPYSYQIKTASPLPRPPAVQKTET